MDPPLGSSSCTGLLPNWILECLVEMTAVLRGETIHIHGLGIEELAFAMVHVPNSLGHFQDLHR